jgi:hypothetical protein
MQFIFNLLTLGYGNELLKGMFKNETFELILKNDAIYLMFGDLDKKIN